MITPLWRVSHVLPRVLDDWIDQMDKATEQAYDRDVIEAMNGNVGAGSNWYADREEWAEFNDHGLALQAEAAMRLVVVNWTIKATRWLAEQELQRQEEDDQ